jgi:hypothetical protein
MMIIHGNVREGNAIMPSGIGEICKGDELNDVSSDYLISVAELSFIVYVWFVSV